MAKRKLTIPERNYKRQGITLLEDAYKYLQRNYDAYDPAGWEASSIISSQRRELENDLFEDDLGWRLAY